MWVFVGVKIIDLMIDAVVECRFIGGIWTFAQAYVRIFCVMANNMHVIDCAGLIKVPKGNFILGGESFEG